MEMKPEWETGLQAVLQSASSRTYQRLMLPEQPAGK